MGIRQEVESRYSRELDGYRRVGLIAYDRWIQNESKVFLDESRPSTAAVLALYAKARKTFMALEVLTREGFGEDAMILARSLTNLCIDLAYIARIESECRARQWMARGRVSRRLMAQTFGQTPPDEHTVNWDLMADRAKRWDSVKIFKRAQDAGLRNFYEVAYRHGSVYEHSDAWGALAFVDIVGDTVEVQPDPSVDLVETALLAGAFAFAQTFESVARFWNFDSPESEMLSVIREAFPRAQDPR